MWVVDLRIENVGDVGTEDCRLQPAVGEPQRFSLQPGGAAVLEKLYLRGDPENDPRGALDPDPPPEGQYVLFEVKCGNVSDPPDRMLLAPIGD